MFEMATLPAVCHGSRLHFPKRATALGGSSPLPRSTWTQLGRCTLLASAVAIRCRGRTVARTAAKTTAVSVKPKGESAETALMTTQAEVSKKLDMFEGVRSVCQSVDIPLPGVVVVGEQSAGKSSLLENISGIQFPRAQNTCTRMPCVLSLLTGPTVKESHAMVSMEPSFANATTCTVPEVEKQIKQLTEEHAPGGDEFISSKAMYIRVVRKEGPQLSLIDLPGVTHNSDEMEDIHEVTVNLVEEYIRPEEMVILCVIPAMSDFGNAEVVKLARKYDPDGIRTLGVVTKCDDAANAEASDIVEKVLMSRPSDVCLELGFHCVVNRSQKNIDEQMSREALWAKEKEIFTKNDRMKRLPEKNWGTLRLMKKNAQIQEARVDECLPEIKESVRRKMGDLQEELRESPPQPETEADRSRLLSGTISKIREDLARRIRAESMKDRDLTIAPIVASMVQDFKSQLLEQNPNWLGEAMVEEVDDTVQAFGTGYTVDNLIGSQVFINLIKQTFIDDGLLKRSVHGLVSDVGEHLRNVVMHVIEAHANNYPVLSTRLDAKAEDCIDQLTVKTRNLCEMLAEAEQVTSTTYGQYTVKLTEFKSWLHDLKGGGTDKLATALRGVEGQVSEVPAEFLSLVKKAQEDNRKLGTLEICASLRIYTGLMIEGFVESSAKLVKFFMMLQLADELEAIWRGDLGALGELFPTDQTLALKKEDLARKIDELSGFKEKLMSLRPAALPAKRRKRTLSAKARAKASATVEHVAPGAFFIWNFAKDLEGKTIKVGDEIKSHKFSQLGVPDLHLSLYPKGQTDTGYMSLHLHAPSGWQIKYKSQAICSPNVVLHEKTYEMSTFESGKGQGWLNFFYPDSATVSAVAVNLVGVIAPNSKI